MRLTELDDLEEQIANLVAEGGLPLGVAVGAVCRRNLSYGVDECVMAAVSVAVHIDSALGLTAENTKSASLARHRVISALAADVAAISTSQRRCSDLVRFWELTEDDIFSF